MERVTGIYDSRDMPTGSLCPFFYYLIRFIDNFPNGGSMLFYEENSYYQ